MSGIDKILQEIEEEGRAAADRIARETEEKISALRKHAIFAAEK